MLVNIEPGKCYKLAGRGPIVVVRIVYGTGNRIRVAGYTPKHYREYMKFNTYDRDTLKLQSEVEGIEMPPLKEFRINSTSKVEEIDVRSLFPNEPWINTGIELGELKHKLALPRVVNVKANLKAGNAVCMLYGHDLDENGKCQRNVPDLLDKTKIGGKCDGW